MLHNVWHADIFGTDQGHGRRAARGRAEGSQKATYRALYLALKDGYWHAFWRARQYRALGSDCQGHSCGPHGDCLPWAHSICSSKRFVSVWEASLRGLQAAMDLGNSLGEPPVHHPLRQANRKGMSVTFAKLLQLVFFYSQDTSIGGERDMPETTFTAWQGKPWTVKVVKDFSSNHSTSSAETSDQSVMMQVCYPILHRNEVDELGWICS